MLPNVSGRYFEPYSEYNLNYDFQIMVQSSKGLRPNVMKGIPLMVVNLYIACVHSQPEKRPTAKKVAQSCKVFIFNVR